VVDGRAAQLLALHGGDEGGDLLDVDLVEPTAAEVRNRVRLKRPYQHLARARRQL